MCDERWPQFSLAGASLMGREHARLGRNNQDAYAYHRGEDQLVVAIADGCGGAAHAEVGAKLAVAWTVGHLGRYLASTREPSEIAAAIDEAFDGLGRYLATVLDGPAIDGVGRFEMVASYGLFTLLAACVLPDRYVVVACGDGLVRVNGATRVLEPESGNRPAYPMYRLVVEDAADGAPVAGRPNLLWTGRTAALEEILLATDGLLPVGEEDLDALRSDRVFRHASALHKQLVLLGSGGKRFRDDATLVYLRRREV